MSNKNKRLDLARELANSDRHMTAARRVYDILSKGGKVQRADCSLISQATWDAFERGYMQAVSDISSGLITTEQRPK